VKKILSVAFFCILLITTSFLLFGNIETLIETNLKSQKSLLVFSVISFSVLASDIILPIPSSIVMILNGKVLGIFFGTIVSLASSLLSSSIGFYVGRKSSSFLEKFFSKKDIVTGNKLFIKFGNSTIIISKALPILSETISFLAGTTSMKFRIFFLYSTIGHLIISIIYACAGNFSGSTNSTLTAAVTIVTVLFTSWIIQIIVRRRTAHNRRFGNMAGRRICPQLFVR